MRTAIVRVDAGTVSPSKALAAVARASDRTLVVVSHRALAELVAECGGYEQAARRLLTIATNAGKPIGVNAPTGPGTSRTWFIPPKGWTQEKAAGWVAAHHAELERAFGDATPIWEDA